MLPLALDLARLKVVLVGNGGAAERRLAALDEAGARDVAVYADAPSWRLASAAGSRLFRRMPSTKEIAAARLVFVAERRLRQCRELAAAARAGGALVHVEDEPALSDVHAPATLRRGELTIAVSTGGKSPALAAQVKRFLGTVFGPEWRGRVDDLAALRQRWRTAGADADTVARRTEAWVAGRGWLAADGSDDWLTGCGAPLKSDFAPKH